MDRHVFTNEQRQLMESMRVPFAVYQFINHRIVTLILSDGFCRLFGYDDRALAYSLMDHNMYAEVHPEDAAGIADAALRFAREEERYDVRYRSRVRGCEGYRDIHAIGEHVYLENGTRLAYVWYTDEGSAAELPLREACSLAPSRYDRLTGLPNMTYFFELAEADRRAAPGAGSVSALLFLDLSGMKYYNAKYSFTEGDKLLAAFARRLAEAFGNENCCHVAADHFAVYTQAQGLEDRLARFFQEWQQDGEAALPIRTGVYIDDAESVPISTACDRAKIACDSLRSSYASSYQYYDKTMQDRIEKRQYILHNLDRAIAEGWIQVYYQPIIRAVTGRVCDEEALARWIDPVRGVLSPADFIPYLEDAGLIYKLDLHVLEQVLEKMQHQKALGFPVIPHSINLSRSDFDKCDIVEEIRRRVDASGLGRDKITIEITESVIGSDFAFMKTQVERFQSLGFPVWMDDFGSGYSSIDVLQSIRFDLLKFDMSFMRKLDEGESGKIVLTELMRLATALGADTVCEGVETAEQVRFLQDIGCAKLQGYYYTKPIPLDWILNRYERGIQIGYENPRESDYYETIGRVNLYDLAVLASEDVSALHNVFNTLPMGIMEINGEHLQYVRANESYRAFMKRFFGIDLTRQGMEYPVNPLGAGAGFMRLLDRCCNEEGRALFDEKMPDGSTVHSIARRIGVNGVTGTIAVAVAVLSITDESQGASYSDIARALAADYYNLYYVDLVTEDFIEYSSPMGREELAMERHGESFFTELRKDVMLRVYEPDRESVLAYFNRESILRSLDEQGVFVMTYRLLEKGEPMYVTMKVMRMSATDRHIIIGLSVTDRQMKQKEADDRLRQEGIIYGRIAALSDRLIVMYTVDLHTDRYYECSAAEEFRSFGLAEEGNDFFVQARINAEKAVYAEDLPQYRRQFTRENIMRTVSGGGIFMMQYRLMIGGEVVRVGLRASLVSENDEEKLIVGVLRQGTGTVSPEL